jgi:PleD family two-component response regulator
MSKEVLLEMADQAMYAGKASGKNCVNRFTRIN